MRLFLSISFIFTITIAFTQQGIKSIDNPIGNYPFEKIGRTLNIVVHTFSCDTTYFKEDCEKMDSLRESELEFLNKHFGPIGLNFTVCQTKKHYYPFEKEIKLDFEQNTLIDTLKNSYYEENTINIYLVPNLIAVEKTDYGYKETALSGLANSPLHKATSYHNNCIFLAAGRDSKTLAHEMGHFFGLAHPHEPYETIKDTPPEPVMNDERVKYKGCEVDYQAMIENGHYDFIKEFRPSVTNIMSYIPSHCQKAFTNEQYIAMKKAYYKYFTYLR